MLGPADAAVSDDRRVLAAAELARGLLAPSAAHVDREGVPRSHVDALAKADLLSLHAPEEYGGTSTVAVVREVTELLAGADASTWFVWTQHKTPVRALVASDNRELRAQWLPRLTTESIGAVAFSHLRRRSGQLVARRVAGGWELDGVVSWLTGWGLADVVLVSADAGQAGYLHVLLDAVPQPGLEVGEPLALAAMQGTHTMAVTFRGLVVGDERVVGATAPEQWHTADETSTADATPACFGIARAAVQDMGGAGAGFADELAALRAQAYAAADAAADLEERVALRGRALELCLRITSAGVAAVGGRAMSLDHPAQRRLREAAFLLVQAQTAPVRAATLRALGSAG